MDEVRTPVTEWIAPLRGHWRRDFRLAEWLPGPVSRSCESWLLPALDRGFSEASLEEYGSGTKPGFVVVNGWCFTTDPMPTKPLAMLAHAPIRMARIASAMHRMASRPEAVERWVAEPGLERYRTRDLPALRSANADAGRRAAAGAPPELIEIVDTLAIATGRLMLGMAQSMGFAAKVEYALASFFADHLEGRVECRPLDLSVGHSPPTPTPIHAVASLDWCEPTAGERATTTRPDEAVHVRQVEIRAEAEAACRATLARDPSSLERFDQLMEMLARWAPIREAMAAEFTLAWPAMRSVLLRLGANLADATTVAGAEDVFELSREEIRAATTGRTLALAGVADERRALRRAQRSLAPPLSIGKPVRQWKQVDAIAALFRTEPPAHDRVIVTGIGSSPGRVTGKARIVLGLDDFSAVEPGEIVVSPGTAPAWAPVLAIAAGVITDAGGAFAHTSIVAREYGIPAIVMATGATRLIGTGDEITLDAAAGTVSAGAHDVP